jgi:hypothetical protein
MVKNKSVFKLLTYWKEIIIFACIPPILFIIPLSIVYAVDISSVKAVGYFYCFMLLSSITFNLVSYAYMLYLLNQPNYNIIQRQLISTIVSRLRIYPLIQIIAQLGLTFFEIHYNWNFNEFPRTHEEAAAFDSIAATSPLFSIGYLISFLFIQPNATNYLLSRLTRCKRFQPDVSKQQESRLRRMFSDPGSSAFAGNVFDDNPQQQIKKLKSPRQDTASESPFDLMSTVEDDELVRLFEATVLQEATSQADDRGIGMNGEKIRTTESRLHESDI